jgi:hypothetical protein
MIVFDLNCAQGHRFEGWFGSSSDFDKQQEGGLVACPECGSQEVGKAPMAPAVPRKANQVSAARAIQKSEGNEERQPVMQGTLPPEVAVALAKLAKAQEKALQGSKWVGEKFADHSRAMHYGERDMEAIHGQASLEEAASLIEEGITIAPLPFPIAPPDELN